MAGQAEIGALHITLGMDSAVFESAAKKVTNTLDGLAFKTAAWTSAMTAAGSVIGRSIGGALNGMTAGFTNAMNSIGDMVDMSQKFGVPVEKLQGLAHAADLSGTSIEGLAKGMQKLAVNMTAIAGGENSGKAASTLSALGLSAMDATGQLKGTDEMLIQLADKFKGMEDGAAKTAMAVNLFGKAGADLIPMLNLGSAELQKLQEEARNLGLVLDGETAAGVEALGDQWTTIGKIMNGFYTQLIGELLPTLKFLSDRIQEWLMSEGGVRAWAENVANALKTVIAWAYEAGAAFTRLKENLANMGQNFADFFAGNWSKIAENNAANAEIMKGIETKLNEDLKAIWAERLATETANEAVRQQTVVPQRLEGTRKMTEGERELNRMIDEGKRLTEEMMTPMEQLIAKQERVNQLFAQGTISVETYGRAMKAASSMNAKNMDALASSVSSNLSTIFGESKAVAIATALINTYQGITKALATYPPPVSTAMAAIQAAAGFAQVANIRSMTSKGGGGGSSSAGGGAASGSVAAAAPQAQQSMFVNLEGEKFGREQVRGLIDQINEAGRDGYKILVTS
jgi:TP901 family phage tail tape measure protein